MHTHLSDSLEQKSRRVPRSHPAGQITGEFCVTGAHKQTHDALEIVVAFQHEKNRLFRIEHPTCPAGENRRATNVESARNMAAAKCKHHQRIDEHARVALNRILVCWWRKSWHAWQISKHFRSL